MNHPDAPSDRRQFLKGSLVAAAAASAAPVSASTAPLDVAGTASVVLHDARIALDSSIAERLAANGARIIALDDDPVRMWRGEIGTVLADPQTRLLGITRWADFMIVRGLAAESRRHVRYEKLDPEAGTLVWLIA